MKDTFCVFFPHCNYCIFHGIAAEGQGQGEQRSVCASPKPSSICWCAQWASVVNIKGETSKYQSIHITPEQNAWGGMVKHAFPKMLTIIVKTLANWHLLFRFVLFLGSRLCIICKCAFCRCIWASSSSPIQTGHLLISTLSDKSAMQ